MADQILHVISWDEISGEPEQLTEAEIGEHRLIASDCDDDELVTAIRRINKDCEDPDGEWGVDWRGRPNKYEWRVARVIRGNKTALIEWQSDRDHIATTTIIWG